MTEKRNIFLVGPTGSGKSTIGKYLAKKLCIDIFDSDQEIEKRTGANINWVFDIEGEESFRNREEKIINEITKKQGIILATGVNSVKSKKIRNYLSARGVVVYLSTTIEKQLMRTQREKRKILLAMNKEPMQTLKKIANECNHFYEEVADIIVNTDCQNIISVSNQIINLINKNTY